MNKIIQSLVNEVVRIEVSGKKMINGTVIDQGSDVIVIYNGTDFVYIPFDHIQNLEIDEDNDEEIGVPSEFPSFASQEDNKELSFREVLTQARGKFIEIFVTEGQTLHGRITSIMNDYFVFQSPVYKTVFISVSHLKWLIPYSQTEKPYGLDDQQSVERQNDAMFAGSFEAQMEKLKDQLVIFNIGGKKSYIGKVNNVDAKIVEIQTARAKPILLNIDHIKSAHQV